MNFSVFETPEVKLPFTFHCAKDVYDNLKGYGKADREMFLVVFLDAKNNALKIDTHTIGTVDSCAVYPREIFKSALLNNACSLICVHHHPSGDIEPSLSDREITKQIVKGGELLGIKILDHVIIGKGKFYSFADEGLIDEFVLVETGGKFPCLPGVASRGLIRQAKIKF